MRKTHGPLVFWRRYKVKNEDISIVKQFLKYFSSPISTPTYTIKDSLFLELLSKIRYEPSTVWAEPAPSGRILPNKMSGMARALSLHSKLKGWVLSRGNTEIFLSLSTPRWLSTCNRGIDDFVFFHGRIKGVLGRINYTILYTYGKLAEGHSQLSECCV